MCLFMAFRVSRKAGFLWSEAENLLSSHPQNRYSGCDAVRRRQERVLFGGTKLWFAPIKP